MLLVRCWKHYASQQMSCRRLSNSIRTMPMRMHSEPNPWALLGNMRMVSIMGDVPNAVEKGAGALLVCEAMRQ